jgi:hypothetical protein
VDQAHRFVQAPPNDGHSHLFALPADWCDDSGFQREDLTDAEVEADETPPQTEAQAEPQGRLSGKPMSIEHHIDDAIAKVPDLSPKQRNALRNTMMAMTRDVSFPKIRRGQGQRALE